MNRREFLGGLATLPFVTVIGLPSLMSIIELPTRSELRAIAWSGHKNVESLAAYQIREGQVPKKSGYIMDHFLLQLPTKHKEFELGTEYVASRLTVTLWCKGYNIGTYWRRLGYKPENFEIIYEGI